MAIELEDEKYVRESLGAQFGITLQKIPHAFGMRTPDYELMSGSSRVAVLEVKRFEQTPRTPENGWERDANGWHTRIDNAPSRVAAVVHAAWQQLRASPDPKVLVFVNDEALMDVGDLEEAIMGFMDYGDAATGVIRNVASSKRSAVKRIREESNQIDLYIWMDRHARGRRGLEFPAGQPPREFVGDDRPRLRLSTDAGYELARRYFGCPGVPKPVTQMRDGTTSGRGSRCI
jgi:hypothetical protein